MKFKKNWRNLLPYKSTLPKDVEKRNVVFNAMDDVSQRKEIALDVLEMLDVEAIVCNIKRHYWEDNVRWELYDIEDSKEFQSKILEFTEPKQECQVCARGALMLSTIRLGNEISCESEDVEFIQKGSSDLLKGFTIEEIKWMELWYEGNYWGVTSDDCNLNNFDFDWQEEYPYQYHTNEMLANLFLNVLHNGKFVEDDCTDYLKLIV